MDILPKPRFLCVFAVSRTGSTFLNSVFSAIPELNAKSALFHNTLVEEFQPAEVDALSQRAGFDVSEKSAFASWRRTHPAATLEAIHQCSRGRITTFKRCPPHLTRDVIESQVIARADVAFAILRRRPIDSFISFSKVRLTRAFLQNDTTDIKPELSVEAFEKWASETWLWYRWCETTLRAYDKPVARICYERDLNLDPIAAVTDALLKRLEPLSLGQLSKPSDIPAPDRQDKEPNYRDRVANWESFEQAAQASPRAKKLLEWAERAPG